MLPTINIVSPPLEWNNTPTANIPTQELLKQSCNKKCKEAVVAHLECFKNVCVENGLDTQNTFQAYMWLHKKDTFDLFYQNCMKDCMR